MVIRKKRNTKPAVRRKATPPSPAATLRAAKGQIAVLRCALEFIAGSTAEMRSRAQEALAHTWDSGAEAEAVRAGIEEKGESVREWFALDGIDARDSLMFVGHGSRSKKRARQ